MTRKGIAVFRTNKYNRIFLYKSERKALKETIMALLKAGKGLPMTILSKDVKEASGVGERSSRQAVGRLQLKGFVNVNQPANKRVRYVNLSPRGRKWAKMIQTLENKRKGELL